MGEDYETPVYVPGGQYRHEPSTNRRHDVEDEATRSIHARSVEGQEDEVYYYDDNGDDVRNLPMEHRGLNDIELEPRNHFDFGGPTGPESFIGTTSAAYPAKKLEEPHQFVHVDGYNKFKAGHNRGHPEHQIQDVQERVGHHHRQEVSE